MTRSSNGLIILPTQYLDIDTLANFMQIFLHPYCLYLLLLYRSLRVALSLHTFTYHYGKPSAAQLHNRKPPRFNTEIEQGSQWYKIIKGHFKTKELLQLITSNYYSILYYNSEIWHLQSLKANLKQKLLSSSARGVKSCVLMIYCALNIIRLNYF